MDKKSGGGLYVRPLRKNTSILSIEVFFCMKEFKTIDEQIEILKNRGLIFKDTNMARRYLLTNNYYNIINGYGNIFKYVLILLSKVQNLMKCVTCIFLINN